MASDQRTSDIRLASAGDADALQRLILQYHTPLLAAVTKAAAPGLRSRIDPADVLQEAYAAAFKALRGRSGREGAGIGEQGAGSGSSGRPPCRPWSGSGSAAPGSGFGVQGSGKEPPANRSHAPTFPVSHADRSHGGPARTPHFDSPAGFYRWLEAIALARLKDQQRALRRKKRDVAREARPPVDRTNSRHDMFQTIIGDESTPSRHVAKEEAIAAVMTSLARLSDDQRAVIHLRFLESRPVAEVAQRLGKSEPAIHMLCHRGLKALRQHLDSASRFLSRG